MKKQNRDEKTVFRAAYSVSVLRSEKKYQKMSMKYAQMCTSLKPSIFLLLPMKMFNVNEQTSLNQLTLLSSSGYTWTLFGTNESKTRHSNGICTKWMWKWRGKTKLKLKSRPKSADQFFCSLLLHFFICSPVFFSLLFSVKELFHRNSSLIISRI